MNIKNALLSVLFCSTILSLSGQLASDQAIVHMDKPYYVSGEMAWFQVYLPEVFRPVSGYVQVLIQNQGGKVVDDYFWTLSDAKIDGYYRIPYNIDPDLYHFSVRALDNNSKEPITITSWSVPIYSDLSADGMQAIYPERSIYDADRSTLSVVVSTDQSSYGRNDQVSLDINLPQGVNAEALSISVTDLSLIGPAAESNIFLTDIAIPANVTLGINDQTFVHGTISNAETDEPVSIGVIGAYHAKYNKMHYTKSNDAGKFTLMLKDHVGDGQLQFAGNLYDLFEDTGVKLFTPSITNKYALTSTYDDDIISYLKESNARKRIYQFYKELESNATFMEMKELERLEVKPNKQVNVKEYVTFENTGLFFNEVLSFVVDFRQKGDDITARMFDPQTTRGGRVYSDNSFPRSPVFIIDGKLTKNAAFVYNLKLTDINEVSVYNDWRDITKQYGTFGDFGYVVINTSQSDLEIPQEDQEDIVTYSGLGRQADYPISLVEDEKEAPKLSPTVYWSPKASSGKISFRSSDDVGEFLVKVVVRDKTGKIGITSTTYKAVRRAN